MSPNIEFDMDQRFTPRNIPNTSRATGMTGLLLRMGIIKDESQAGIVLIGLLLFNIIVTIAVLYYFVF